MKHQKYINQTSLPNTPQGLLTFTHLTDAFIQSASAIKIYISSWGIEPTTCVWQTQFSTINITQRKKNNQNNTEERLKPMITNCCQQIRHQGLYYSESLVKNTIRISIHKINSNIYLAVIRDSTVLNGTLLIKSKLTTQVLIIVPLLHLCKGGRIALRSPSLHNQSYSV